MVPDNCIADLDISLEPPMGKDASPWPDEMIGVLIIDDHPVFREGLQNVLECESDIHVMGQGGDGKQALQFAHDYQPDIILMDINIPSINGIQVTRQLNIERTRSRVIILTAYDDQDQMLHAMRAGAAAYCPKDVMPDRLVEVIRQVALGRYVVGDQIFDAEGIQDWMSKGVEARSGPYYVDPDETFAPLSPREMEILQHVTRGLSNKQIALALGISHQTVKNHMTSILKKLAVQDRTQAAVFALRRGWVRLQDAEIHSKDD
jgi:two-component system response regulator DegU